MICDISLSACMLPFNDQFFRDCARKKLSQLSVVCSKKEFVNAYIFLYFPERKSSGILRATTSPWAVSFPLADSVTEITILRPLLSFTRPLNSRVVSIGVGAK